MSKKWTWTVKKYATPQDQKMIMPKEQWIYCCKDRPSEKKKN